MVSWQWILGAANVMETYISQPATSKCSNPRSRKSWALMADTEKAAYITAVQCLMTAPAKGTSMFPNAVSRYDDFVATHIYYSTPPDPLTGVNGHGFTGPGIHFNGVFLPWHRYFNWAYESALINECNYKGAQPYWDWTGDNPEYGSSFEKSPVFLATNGFGGNGGQGSLPVPAVQDQQEAPTGSCITDGPFANVKATFGYGYSVASNPHCILRNFNITMANESLGWTKNMVPLLAITDYWKMSQEWDYSSVGAPIGAHGAGHKAVGGDLSNIWSSVTDPLFFLHHTQIDHIFWLWQTQAKANAAAIGGPIYPNGTGTVDGNFPIEMTPFIAPSTKVSSVLDTVNGNGKGVLCYIYEDTGVAGYKHRARR